MSLKDKVLKGTQKVRRKADYKTTSFTLLKSDYEQFKAACKKSERMPSDVLREMALIFVRESK